MISSWLTNRRLDKKPLPLDRVWDYHARFAAHKGLAWHNIVNGCIERAHIMCREVIGEGHMPYKAWAFAPSQPDVQTYHPNLPRLEVVFPDGATIRHEEGSGWYKHVALALLTEPFEGNSPSFLIIDPGLYNGPARPEAWCRSLNAPEHILRSCNMTNPRSVFSAHTIRSRWIPSSLKHANPETRLAKIGEEPEMRRILFETTVPRPPCRETCRPGRTSPNGPNHG